MTDEIIAHCMNCLIQGMIYLQCDNFDGLIAPLEKAAVPYVIAADNRGTRGRCAPMSTTARRRATRCAS